MINVSTIKEIKSIIKTMLVISIIVAILGACYLIFEDLQTKIPWFQAWAKDCILWGITWGVVCLVMLNVQIIISYMWKWIIHFLLNILNELLKPLGKVILIFLERTGTIERKAKEDEIKKEIIQPQKISISSEHFNNNISKFPPMELLQNQVAVFDSEQVQELKSMLLRFLKEYGLDFLTLDKIEQGPAVTQFVLKMNSEGRYKKVLNLQQELSMFLQVESVTIKTSTQGIIFEIPNKQRMTVYLKEVLERFFKQYNKSVLSVPIGKTVTGELQVIDIAKLPHLLIAGQTGGGKSVCVNGIIVSLIMKCSPEELKFIMVDPKVVELSIYNGIPHLLFPVITDTQKAIQKLNWAVEEMERRYRLFAPKNVRNIQTYNEKVSKSNRLHSIVIVIDELAELIMAGDKQLVETEICRLGQLGRAAGIHMIIATQRPSVDVITGLIKANIPARIAFSVASSTDSKVILDHVGAEKLLGQGDGLVSITGMKTPVRFQNSFLSDDEIERVVEWWKGKTNESNNLTQTNFITENEVALTKETAQEQVLTEQELNIAYEENELKIRILLNELAYVAPESNDVLLPPKDEIAKKIGIRKAEVVQVIKKLENLGLIETDGEGRGKKSYLKISQDEAYDFLILYSPRSIEVL